LTASRSSSRSTRSSSGGFSPALNADGLQELLQRMVAAVREAPVPLPSDADSEYDDGSECYAPMLLFWYKFPRCKLCSGFWLTSAWFCLAACLGLGTCSAGF
jgi:hypothetical protein